MASVSIDAESLRQMVTEAQQGDRVAADRLVRAHEDWVRSAVYAVTGRLDLVDDVAQQVWTRVWERLDTLKNPGGLRAWLYRIARNTALDSSIAQRRRSLAEQPLRLVTGWHHPDPLAGLARDELRRTVLTGIQALPAIYREPFVLRHVYDWTYAEIGDVLDLPTETVETRLVRARRLLRESLQDKVLS